MVEDVDSVPPLRRVGAERGRVDRLQDGLDDGIGKGLKEKDWGVSCVYVCVVVRVSVCMGRGGARGGGGGGR